MATWPATSWRSGVGDSWEATCPRPSTTSCFELGGNSRAHVVYTRLVAEGFPAGIACDDGAAAHYRGRDLVEVVADRPGARGYRVSSSGIEPLAATRLLR